MIDPPRIHMQLAQAIDNEATGRDCRTWRNHHKVSLDAVAHHMGISIPMLSMMERGLKGWTANRVTEFVYAVKEAKKR